MTQKAGYAVFLGEPNVGKSSLLNAIVGEKIAIVTHKAQTTRKRVAGVYTFDDTQVVFLDLPGIHASEKKLNQFMMNEVLSALGDADVFVWLLDATKKEPLNKSLKDVYQKVCLTDPNKPHLVVWTKRDLTANKPSIELFNKHPQFFVSSKTKEGTGEFLYELCSLMPASPFFFDADSLTDWQIRDLVAEIIREKCLLSLHEEIPYALTVVIDSFTEESQKTRIEATLVVDQDSQKGIVIGHKGQTIKKIGTMARPDIEKLLDKKVFLALQVKVDKNWTKNAHKLREYGYSQS